MSVQLVKNANAVVTGELPVIPPAEVVIADSSYWSRESHAEYNPIGWALAQEWAELYKELEVAK